MVTRQEATIARQQNEFHATAAQQEKELQALTASLKEQAAQIQKVCAQLKTSNSAAQVIARSR